MGVWRPKKVSLLFLEGLKLLQVLLRLDREGCTKTARRFLSKLNQREYISYNPVYKSTFKQKKGVPRPRVDTSRI